MNELEQIEGIGPKTSELLAKLNIFTTALTSSTIFTSVLSSSEFKIYILCFANIETMPFCVSTPSFVI